MGTTTSSSRVEETISTHYDYASVLEEQVNGEESFRLYRVTSCRFEAILYNPKHSPHCFSLYRVPEETEARKKFRYGVIHYPILLQYNDYKCEIAVLRLLMDGCR